MSADKLDKEPKMGRNKISAALYGATSLFFMIGAIKSKPETKGQRFIQIGEVLLSLGLATQAYLGWNETQTKECKPEPKNNPLPVNNDLSEAEEIRTKNEKLFTEIEKAKREKAVKQSTLLIG